MPRLTNEERVAQKLSDAVIDVTINLDLVGMYLARAFPNVVFHRLQNIIEATEFERENKYDREYYNL
jgi:hypothetical protein